MDNQEDKEKNEEENQQDEVDEGDGPLVSDASEGSESARTKAKDKTKRNTQADFISLRPGPG